LLRLHLSDIALERHSRIVCDCHQSGMCAGTPFPPAQGSKLDTKIPEWRLALGGNKNYTETDVP